MLTKVRFILTALLLATASIWGNAQTAVVRGVTPVDFGAIVPAVVGLGSTVTVTAQGVITSSGVASQSGGHRGSFTIATSDSSGAQAYASVASAGSTSASLLGCGSLLSLVTVSNLTLGSGGPKSTPGTFYYGATLSFTNVLGLTCVATGCINNAFYYNLGAPATSSANQGAVQLCFVINFSPTPIAITHPSGVQLSFGKVCSPNSGLGYVTIDSSGIRSTRNIPCALDAGTADTFNVTGTANSVYNVILPTSVNINNGSSVLTVDTFTSSCSRCNINIAGRDSFTVGGRVAIPAGVTPGTYSGSYTVSVIY